MTKKEALKNLAMLGAGWFGNSKQHFAFSAYDRFNGWNKLADKWKEEAEEEWDEAEEVLNRLVELGYKPAELQKLMKTMEFPFFDFSGVPEPCVHPPEGHQDIIDIESEIRPEMPGEEGYRRGDTAENVYGPHPVALPDLQPDLNESRDEGEDFQDFEKHTANLTEITYLYISKIWPE